MKQIIIFLVSLMAATGLSAESKEVFVENNNTKIFCKSEGEGDPLIVIHGGPGLSMDYLLPQMSELTTTNFVIFYDQRGCGRSSGEIGSETINIETFISDLEAIREAFHLKKVSILGHSWGGFLAMQYVLAHPDHIDKIILSNSLPASSEDMALFLKEWVARMEPYQSKLAEFHANPGFEEGDPTVTEEMHRVIFRTYCHNPEKANLLSLKMSQKACVNGAKVYELLRQNVLDKPFNLHPNLNLLKIETLVLHGDSDPIPPITAQNIHKSIPNSKYVLMKNCGHFPYVEDPDTYFNVINQFLHEK